MHSLPFKLLEVNIKRSEYQEASRRLRNFLQFIDKSDRICGHFSRLYISLLSPIDLLKLFMFIDRSD